MANWEVVLDWLQIATEAKTVLHYQDDNGGDVDWQGVADAIDTGFLTDLASTIAPSVTLESITVRQDIAGGVGQTYVGNQMPAAGTANDNQFIRQAAALVQKKAANLVRPNKGRIYQPGVTTEGTTAGGNWSGTVLSALDTFWTAMLSLADGEDAHLTMVIKASNPSAPNTVAYNVVDSVEANSNPATQRRRRIGVGS